MFESISLLYLIEFFFSYKSSNPTNFLILSKMTSFRCKKHQNDIVLTLKKKKLWELVGSTTGSLVRSKTIFCIEPDRFVTDRRSDWLALEKSQ